jgi:hypothetical protein
VLAVSVLYAVESFVEDIMQVVHDLVAVVRLVADVFGERGARVCVAAHGVLLLVLFP